MSPALTVGQTYNVRMRKLDQTNKFCVNWPSELPARCLEAVSAELQRIYTGPQTPAFVKPEHKDYVVFTHAPGLLLLIL